MKLCSNCWENKCICKKRQYVLIDNGMVDIIRGLNKKGYETRNCCEGHVKQDVICTYVQFRRVYSFEEIPEGFTYSVYAVEGKILCDTSRVVRKNYNKKKGFEDQEDDEEFASIQLLESERQKHLNILKVWVEQLPYVPRK